MQINEMIQLKLILLGLTVIGTIGYVVYNHYRSQEQQHQYGSYSRRRRRSLEDDVNSTFTSNPQPTDSRKLKNVKFTCSICLTIVEENSQYLSCGHSFHQRCIQMWFNSEKNTCPNCRAVNVF